MSLNQADRFPMGGIVVEGHQIAWSNRDRTSLCQAIGSKDWFDVNMRA
jgi:hypothetical protein